MDKHAVEIPVSCPKLIQTQMVRSITRSDPNFDVPSNLNEIFDNAAAELSYTKATKKDKP